jgi:hypothetical protein
LGLLVTVRRYPLSRALVSLSTATVISSMTLIAILWFEASSRQNDGTLTVWSAGGATLPVLASWLFFLVLVARCALWFASRSLRSDLAASLKLSWLAVTELAYFLGFIIGLFMGSVSVAGRGNMVGALLLDVLLLSAVAGCDLFQSRPVSSGRTQPKSRPFGEDIALEKASFWRLTAAFGASTIACQVVIFHFAEMLARTNASALPAWSDVTVATFYLGVAGAAALSAWAGPRLERVGNRAPRVVLRSVRQVVSIPFVVLVTLAGILILLGLFGITSTTRMADGPSPWSAGGVLALAAMGVGAGIFEFLVLAVVGRIRFGGNGTVALAFGLVVTAAAIALFLMMLSQMRFIGGVATTVTGLALMAWFVRGVKNLDGWDDSRR